MLLRGAVVRVVDGDTVWIRVRVRTLKSTPDSGPAAIAATEDLQRRFPVGARCQIGINAIDPYGRILGNLFPDRSGLE